MSKKKLEYVEPADYFPKSVRKEFKIGEYAEKKPTAKSKTTANNKKK